MAMVMASASLIANFFFNFFLGSLAFQIINGIWFHANESVILQKVVLTIERNFRPKLVTPLFPNNHTLIERRRLTRLAVSKQKIFPFSQLLFYRSLAF